jgi:hypothetical protein
VKLWTLDEVRRSIAQYKLRCSTQDRGQIESKHEYLTCDQCRASSSAEKSNETVWPESEQNIKAEKNEAIP